MILGESHDTHIGTHAKTRTAITGRSRKSGMDAAGYAKARLFNDTALDEPANGTGADLVAYWKREGLIGTRPDIEDSQVHARAIRDKAERRNHG